jgi:hypothetical protein
MTYLWYYTTAARKETGWCLFLSVGPLVTFVMPVSEWYFTALTSYAVTPTLCSGRVSFHKKWISGNKKRNGAVVDGRVEQGELTHQSSLNRILWSLIIVKDILMDIFHYQKHILHTQFFEAYLCFYRNAKVDIIIKPVVALHNIT